MTGGANAWFWAAAVPALAACFAHPWLGRPHVARLLAAKDLPVATRWLAFLCWHGITVVFVVMFAALAASATGWATRDAAAVAGALAAGIAILSAAVAMRAGHAPWRYPPSYVLGLVAILVGVGLST